MRQKRKVRRGWIKVHIAVDDQNKQVASKPRMSPFQILLSVHGESSRGWQSKG